MIRPAPTSFVARMALAALIALLLPLAAAAQGEPNLSVEMEEGDVIVGQPVTLRLKLLVPTWMPKPPVWPTLEVPSLLVRLPERASTPISEKINGETWSGISRAYRLYPLEVGIYEIPAQDLLVTYAEPGKTDPLTASLSLDPVRFTAILPKGAADLDPPIIAAGLTLEQSIEGGPDMVTGDAVTRTITITIKGTTPILLPSLMPEIAPPPDGQPARLRAYPKEPAVTESENRGVLSGSKTETTTYIAQVGGTAELPQITLRWFNLETDQVETATLEGRSLTLTAPPPPPPGLAEYARWAGNAVVILTGIWGLVRLIGPRVHRLVRRLAARWRASETFAHRRVLKTLNARDLSRTMAALDVWYAFWPSMTDRETAKLDQSLAALGAQQFGPSGDQPANRLWSQTRSTYSRLRRAESRRSRRKERAEILPPLNPVGSVRSR